MIGCGRLTHVHGTNGGQMPCGAMLTRFGKTEPYYCTSCEDSQTINTAHSEIETLRSRLDAAVALLRRAVAVPMISADATLYGDIEETLASIDAAAGGGK